jgi:hypothetical protein
MKSILAGMNTYAGRIRVKMVLFNGPGGKPLSLRELSERIGMSYEHCRKVIAEGSPIASEAFNEAVCGVLGLDAAAMWTRLLDEKVAKRFGPKRISAPEDSQLAELWPRLSESDKELIRRLAVRLALPYETQLQTPLHAQNEQESAGNP